MTNQALKNTLVIFKWTTAIFMAVCVILSISLFRADKELKRLKKFDYHIILNEPTTIEDKEGIKDTMSVENLEEYINDDQL